MLFQLRGHGPQLRDKIRFIGSARILVDIVVVSVVVVVVMLLWGWANLVGGWLFTCVGDALMEITCMDLSIAQDLRLVSHHRIHGIVVGRGCPNSRIDRLVRLSCGRAGCRGGSRCRR